MYCLKNIACCHESACTVCTAGIPAWMNPSGTKENATIYERFCSIWQIVNLGSRSKVATQTQM